MARQRDTTANSAPPAAPQTDSPVFSPISGTLRLIWRCVAWLFLSVVIGTVLDWLGMLAGWWGPDHSLTVLSQDIAWLGEHFTTSILGRSPAEVALAISRAVHDYLSFQVQPSPRDSAFIALAKQTALTVQPYWQGVIFSAMNTVVRLFIILLSAVFFIVVFVVALIDGLVERELRKEGGGIEHAAVFHHAKIWVSRPLAWSPIVYLSVPVSINPAWVVLPSALVFGMATYIAFFTFRKYV